MDDIMGEVDAQDHMDKVASRIHDDIDRMLATYDTPVLAVAMLLRAAGMLQALRAANIWGEADVVDVMTGTTSLALTELPDDIHPKVVTIGGSASVN